MADKNNDHESAIDKTTFFWTANCGICHPGGGPGERDRDGELHHDVSTGQFGYEKLGKTADEVRLDGDYAFLNPMNGDVTPGRWDLTGLSEPDCLFCHRGERTVVNGKNMNWIWRAGTLRGGPALVDDQGETVKAFLAGATAGQGWFSSFELQALPPGNPPKASKLQIDYSGGVSDGTLRVHTDGSLILRGDSLVGDPKDYACWGCHAISDTRKRARVWFDPAQDVHYAAFNHLDDADPDNDVGRLDSSACTVCHPSGLDHDFSKGSAFSSSVQDETDYLGMRTCGDCHLADSPVRHPEAPAPVSELHFDDHFEAMSCQFCHVPHKEALADLVVDNAVSGATVVYTTDKFLSSDPLDPSGPEKDRWNPAFRKKRTPDGFSRLYPVKLLLSAWWGDWNRSGTPGDRSDDVIAPIILWRVRQITGGMPLPGVTDDNGDGVLEVNRPEEISLYLDALTDVDRYGRPVAVNPVLVKGGRVFFRDRASPTGVSSFHVEGTGMRVESEHPFSLDHNVVSPSRALGSDGCGTCHRLFNGGMPTPVFDRLVLIDPYDESGLPVFETVRHLTGVDPF